MKTVFKIARTELRVLFYSPIAWFLMIVFLIQCAMTYFGGLGQAAKTQEIGGMGLLYLKRITGQVFTSPAGLFSSVMQKLYLYIPLLTMGLISRETSSGTIKLLYSSPIKVQKIIFGKFLAMMIYSLLLVALVSIFMVMGMYNIKNAEGGILITGAIGLYLLLCAYSSIGLFMSCLTTYQVVAAVCTFVMIGILSYIGTLWQGIDFVRDLTYFLSLSGRAEKMLNGLITTKDIIYFILIVYIFLGLSIYRLRSGMESKSSLLKAARYIMVVVIALIIGYISSRPNLVGYYDATANKTKTLTPRVQGIIKGLGEKPLEVTAYDNLIGSYSYYGMPESRNQDFARWEPYVRFKHNIKLKYVLYYDSAMDNSYLMKVYPGKSVKEIAEQYAKSSDFKMSMFKTPAEIRKVVDLRPELNRYVMQLKYNGRTTFLRVFDDMQVWPSETEVSAAIKRLLDAKLPKVAFLTGDLERDINKIGDKGYRVLTTLSTFRNSLVNQGFNVDTVSLATQEIPTDISILVIADPKIELSIKTMAKLQQYIANGGNLLIAGEPGKQSILNPLLQQLGIQLTDGIVVQQSKDFSPDLVTTGMTTFAAGFSKSLTNSVADSLPVSMSGVAGISYIDGGSFVVQPLLRSNEKLTWNRKQKLDLEMVSTADASRNTKNRAGTVVFSPADGDVKGPIVTAVALTRKINGKEQRIIVTGDADFMSNSELQRGSLRTANFVFNTSLFSWLSSGQFPIDTSRPDSKDNRVAVTTDDVDVLKIIFLWVLPGIITAFGAILLIRRQRK